MKAFFDYLADNFKRRSAYKATYGQLCNLTRRELDDIGVSSASSTAWQAAEMEVAQARARRATRRHGLTGGSLGNFAKDTVSNLSTPVGR